MEHDAPSPPRGLGLLLLEPSLILALVALAPQALCEPSVRSIATCVVLALFVVAPIPWFLRRGALAGVRIVPQA